MSQQSTHQDALHGAGWHRVGLQERLPGVHQGQEVMFAYPYGSARTDFHQSPLCEKVPVGGDMARKKKQKLNLPRVPLIGMNLGSRFMGDRRTRRQRTRGARKLQFRKEFEGRVNNPPFVFLGYW